MYKCAAGDGHTKKKRRIIQTAVQMHENLRQWK